MDRDLAMVGGEPGLVKELGGGLKEFPFDPDWLNLNHGGCRGEQGAGPR